MGATSKLQLSLLLSVKAVVVVVVVELPQTPNDYLRSARATRGRRTS